MDHGSDIWFTGVRGLPFFLFLEERVKQQTRRATKAKACAFLIVIIMLHRCTRDCFRVCCRETPIAQRNALLWASAINTIEGPSEKQGVLVFDDLLKMMMTL